VGTAGLSSLADAAAWLLAEVERRGGTLDEDVATLEIVRLFGGDLCELTDDGRFVVAQRLRDEIERAATTWDRELVWDARLRAWQSRERRGPYR
jgi:hypothetical protein